MLWGLTLMSWGCKIIPRSFLGAQNDGHNNALGFRTNALGLQHMALGPQRDLFGRQNNALWCRNNVLGSENQALDPQHIPWGYSNNTLGPRFLFLMRSSYLPSYV